MPRIAKVVAPDYPDHLTQRGNGRQPIFRDDEDRCRSLSWINEYSLKHRLSLMAYCLMKIHLHFVALPGEEDVFAKAFRIAHIRYAQSFR